MNLTEKIIKTACGKEMKVYNELLPKPGLYVCHNEVTNLIYLGKAVNVKERTSTHVYQLRKNEKRKKNGSLTYWQKSFNKHGEDKFHFYSVTYSDFIPDDSAEKILYSAEKVLIKKYDSMKYGYNETSGGEGVDSDVVKRYWKDQGVFYSSEGVSIPSVQKEIRSSKMSVSELTELVERRDSIFLEYENKDEKYFSLLEEMADSILANNIDDEYSYNVQKFNDKLERECWSETEGYDLELLMDQSSVIPEYNSKDLFTIRKYDLEREDLLGNTLREYKHLYQSLKDSSLSFRQTSMLPEVRRDIFSVLQSSMICPQNSSPHISTLKGHISSDEINLLNKNHVLELLSVHISEIKDEGIKLIIKDLDELIEKTELDNEEKYVVSKYKTGVSKAEIARELNISKVKTMRCLLIASNKISKQAKSFWNILSKSV